MDQIKATIDSEDATAEEKTEAEDAKPAAREAVDAAKEALAPFVSALRADVRAQREAASYAAYEEVQYLTTIIEDLEHELDVAQNGEIDDETNERDLSETLDTLAEKLAGAEYELSQARTADEQMVAEEVYDAAFSDWDYRNTQIIDLEAEILMREGELEGADTALEEAEADRRAAATADEESGESTEDNYEADEWSPDQGEPTFEAEDDYDYGTDEEEVAGEGDDTTGSGMTQEEGEQMCSAGTNKGECNALEDCNWNLETCEYVGTPAAEDDEVVNGEDASEDPNAAAREFCAAYHGEENNCTSEES